MSSTSRTWTDYNAPTSKMLKYFIAVKRKGSCLATNLKAGGGPFVESVSNIEDNRLRSISTGVLVNLQNSQINLYPNPFTEFTEIQYTIEKPSTVEIIITDVSGKQVQLLMNEKQPIGNYKLEVGDKLKSGMYILNVNINGKRWNYKLVKI